MSQTSDDFIDTDADDIPIAANRRVLVLRALRIGGLIAFLVALLLACPWWDGFPVPQSHVIQFLLFGAPLPLLWLLGFWKGASKVWVVCLVIIDAVPLAAFQVYRWWLFHSQSSVSVTLFLVLALLTLGLGVFIVEISSTSLVATPPIPHVSAPSVTRMPRLGGAGVCAISPSSREPSWCCWPRLSSLPH